MNDFDRQSATQENQSDAKARREKGEFVRGVSAFRYEIGDKAFPAETGRYHVYVALNCPWCHRVTLARNVLGLEDSISMDVLFPTRTSEIDPAGPNLWQFAPENIAIMTDQPLPECTSETATGKGLRLVTEIYQLFASKERSVPILFDKKSQQIVSNESADIIRMFNRFAEALGSTLPNGQRPDLYPQDEQIREVIDAWNAKIYNAINNGAYKAGFSSDQRIYAAAFHAYFDMLDTLENTLSDGRNFLTGETFTEADLRLFPTLYRHDPVYYLRMKLNGGRILDYPHLWRWLCRVYALPGVPNSSSLVHCVQGYFGRSDNGILPIGPIKPMAYPQAYDHPELAMI